MTRGGDSHGLDELFDLLVQSTDISVRISRLLIHLHRLHSRVVFCRIQQPSSRSACKIPSTSLNPHNLLRTSRQSIQNQITILVHPDQIARSQLVSGNEPDHGQEHGLSGRRLDDGAFRIGGGRCVLGGSLFRGRFVGYVEDLKGEMIR